MVQLHLLLLLLLLLELEAHELVLLLRNSAILHSLALQRLVLLLNFLHDLFELLDAFRVLLVFLLLCLILLSKLYVKLLLEFVVRRGQVILGLAELLEFTVHLLFALVPLLSLDGSILFLVLQLIFKFKYLLRKLFDFCGHVSDLFFVLRLGFSVSIGSLDLLFLQLLNQLPLLLVLRLRLLSQVLDLLNIKSLLLVIL